MSRTRGCDQPSLVTACVTTPGILGQVYSHLPSTGKAAPNRREFSKGQKHWLGNCSLEEEFSNVETKRVWGLDLTAASGSSEEAVRTLGDWRG